ncbi:T9SS type A sorting domain-containing protein [Hymenobacter properus]|uniref:T9SS type A sorting domain-containing protein n=1 Tax=Hymenobacter properus TaxID=2791026 RepID=A0A931BJ92_9BACT|nr:T9SS type A sorting domain-containing protein [Hymenobacter properus]MBF9143303.1 T9SS type A sorting domain-containing protein [Hymenobacter properus]MBR7722113.1 T9SS type A sorting domain-containing protein [Microvirga sp. SRT04]
MKKTLRYLLLLLLALGLMRPAHATALPTTGPSLAEVLNPDGTLRPGANGSFDAREFCVSTAPDGRPVFRPAGTTGTGDERWQNGFGLNGAERRINVVVRVGNDIYVGGAFRLIGNLAANYVAKWNGTAWSSLGTGAANGTDSEVVALAVAGNGDVYASGFFSLAGGIPANGLAKWNGTAWGPLSPAAGNDLDGFASALAIAPNGDLYVGGAISRAGAVPVNNVARWNGTAWSALGAGVSLGTASGRPVNALVVAANGDLYAGGSFTEAGGAPAFGVARWNGTSWNPLGTGTANGVNGAVAALAIAPNGDLYVGGSFAQAGGAPANNVARWNGTAWSAVGTGTTGTGVAVQTLGVAANGDLYIGGNFTQAGGATVSRVARWNGTAWSAVGTPPANAIGTTVLSLTVTTNGDVYAASSDFNTIASTAAYYLLRWNGTAWNTVSTGLNGVFGINYNTPIYALTTAANGDVYAGGELRMAGSAIVNSVARWNGAAWSPVGPAVGGIINSAVRAVAVAPNGDVYIGGNFTQIGGAAINYVARWNGTTWSALGTGTANSVNNTVNALALAPNGDVYVGGNFTQAGGAYTSYIARWNGTVWSAVGNNNGADGPVHTLLVASNGDLYVGGGFNQVGGVLANHIAKWNGSAWSGMGAGPANGVDAYVSALGLAANGDLYVGGGFTQAGGVPASRVARWNGTAWGPVGTGAANGTNGAVSSLVVTGNGDIYVGGDFTQFDGVAAARTARWNGTAWSPLGTGLNNAVFALALGTNGKLHFGGSFTGVGDGSKVMSRFAIYDPAAPLAATAAKAALAAQLFPNPAHGAATLRLPAGAPRLPLTLVDAQGRTVRRYPAPATAEAALDLRGLPAGTYLVRCGEYTQRLVVE